MKVINSGTSLHTSITGETTIEFGVLSLEKGEETIRIGVSHLAEGTGNLVNVLKSINISRVGK